MPTILVVSNDSRDRDSTIVFAEDVRPEHLASEHHAAQLIERVGWALTDAEQGEGI